MKPCLHFALLVILLAAIQGCAVSLPDSRVAAYGVEANVVDADTDAPIANALIYVSRPDARVNSDADGHFRIDPVIESSAMRTIYQIGDPIWPCNDEVVRQERRFTVTAPGYEEATYTAVLEGVEAPCGLGATLRDGTFCLSKVRMRRAPLPMPSVCLPDTIRQ